MTSRSEFFENLKDGEEYLILFATKGTFKLVRESLRDNMVISSVKQKNNAFDQDPIHKELLSRLSKAKKELRDYEYEKNHV